MAQLLDSTSLANSTAKLLAEVTGVRDLTTAASTLLQSVAAVVGQANNNQENMKHAILQKSGEARELLVSQANRFTADDFASIKNELSTRVTKLHNIAQSITLVPNDPTQEKMINSIYTELQNIYKTQVKHMQSLDRPRRAIDKLIPTLSRNIQVNVISNFDVLCYLYTRITTGPGGTDVTTPSYIWTHIKIDVLLLFDKLIKNSPAGGGEQAALVAIREAMDKQIVLSPNQVITETADMRRDIGIILNKAWLFMGITSNAVASIYKEANGRFRYPFTEVITNNVFKTSMRDPNHNANTILVDQTYSVVLNGNGLGDDDTTGGCGIYCGGDDGGGSGINLMDSLCGGPQFVSMGGLGNGMSIILDDGTTFEGTLDSYAIGGSSELGVNNNGSSINDPFLKPLEYLDPRHGDNTGYNVSSTRGGASRSKDSADLYKLDAINSLVILIRSQCKGEMDKEGQLLKKLAIWDKTLSSMSGFFKLGSTKQTKVITTHNEVIKMLRRLSAIQLLIQAKATNSETVSDIALETFREYEREMKKFIIQFDEAKKRLTATPSAGSQKIVTIKSYMAPAEGSYEIYSQSSGLAQFFMSVYDDMIVYLSANGAISFTISVVNVATQTSNHQENLFEQTEDGSLVMVLTPNDVTEISDTLEAQNQLTNKTQVQNIKNFRELCEAVQDARWIQTGAIGALWAVALKIDDKPAIIRKACTHMFPDRAAAKCSEGSCARLFGVGTPSLNYVADSFGKDAHDALVEERCRKFITTTYGLGFHPQFRIYRSRNNPDARPRFIDTSVQMDAYLDSFTLDAEFGYAGPNNHYILNFAEFTNTEQVILLKNMAVADINNNHITSTLLSGITPIPFTLPTSNGVYNLVGMNGIDPYFDVVTGEDTIYQGFTEQTAEFLIPGFQSQTNLQTDVGDFGVRFVEFGRMTDPEIRKFLLHLRHFLSNREGLQKHLQTIFSGPTSPDIDIIVGEYTRELNVGVNQQDLPKMKIENILKKINDVNSTIQFTVGKNGIKSCDVEALIESQLLDLIIESSQTPIEIRPFAPSGTGKTTSLFSEGGLFSYFVKNSTDATIKIEELRLTSMPYKFDIENRYKNAREMYTWDAKGDGKKLIDPYFAYDESRINPIDITEANILDFVRKIDRERKAKGRILETLNNKDSSRSTMKYTIRSASKDPGKFNHMILTDPPGKENYMTVLNDISSSDKAFFINPLAYMAAEFATHFYDIIYPGNYEQKFVHIQGVIPPEFVNTLSFIKDTIVALKALNPWVIRAAHGSRPSQLDAPKLIFKSLQNINFKTEKVDCQNIYQDSADFIGLEVLMKGALFTIGSPFTPINRITQTIMVSSVPINVNAAAPIQMFKLNVRDANVDDISGAGGFVPNLAINAMDMGDPGMSAPEDTSVAVNFTLGDKSGGTSSVVNASNYSACVNIMSRLLNNSIYDNHMWGANHTLLFSRMSVQSFKVDIPDDNQTYLVGAAAKIGFVLAAVMFEDYQKYSKTIDMELLLTIFIKICDLDYTGYHNLENIPDIPEIIPKEMLPKLSSLRTLIESPFINDINNVYIEINAAKQPLRPITREQYNTLALSGCRNVVLVEKNNKNNYCPTLSANYLEFSEYTIVQKMSEEILPIRLAVSNLFTGTESYDLKGGGYAPKKLRKFDLSMSQNEMAATYLKMLQIGNVNNILAEPMTYRSLTPSPDTKTSGIAAPLQGVKVLNYNLYSNFTSTGGGADDNNKNRKLAYFNSFPNADWLVENGRPKAKDGFGNNM